MQRSARISVVVPAYNHAKFVGEAIDSALTQTLADLEVIVVDDGSTDATLAIAQQRAEADTRVRVISQRNGGSHAAINRGIAEAAAPWIAILNSDDRFHPERLATMLAACGERFDFAVTDARVIDADGVPIENPAHWWLAANRSVREYARTHGALDGLMFGNYTVSTSNFVIRRGLFDTIGSFRPLRHVLDWEFALRAATHAPDRFIYLQDQPLFDYRIHGGNAILASLARGAAEMDWMQRELLGRLGVPPGLRRAMVRTQRDLRRHAAARMERIARDNERIAIVNGRVAMENERIAHEREADRLQLERELNALRDEVDWIRSTRAWRVLRRLGLMKKKD